MKAQHRGRNAHPVTAERALLRLGESKGRIKHTKPIPSRSLFGRACDWLPPFPVGVLAQSETEGRQDEKLDFACRASDGLGVD